MEWTHNCPRKHVMIIPKGWKIKLLALCKNPQNSSPTDISKLKGLRKTIKTPIEQSKSPQRRPCPGHTYRAQGQSLGVASEKGAHNQASPWSVPAAKICNCESLIDSIILKNCSFPIPPPGTEICKPGSLPLSYTPPPSPKDFPLLNRNSFQHWKPLSEYPWRPSFGSTETLPLSACSPHMMTLRE